MNIYEAFQRGFLIYFLSDKNKELSGVVYLYQYQEMHRELSKHLSFYLKDCTASLEIEIVDNDYLNIVINVEDKESLKSDNLKYENKKLIEFIKNTPDDGDIYLMTGYVQFVDDENYFPLPDKFNPDHDFLLSGYIIN